MAGEGGGLVPSQVQCSGYTTGCKLSLFFFCCSGKIHVKELQEEVQECNVKICQLSLKLKQQDDDILHLREELKRLLTELSMTRITLKEIADKLPLLIDA